MAASAEIMIAPLHALAADSAFEEWLRTEQRRVYRLCLRFLRDTDEADAATQDVFLKAYQALQQPKNSALEDPAKWLTRITVNTCMDRLRSQRWQFWRKRPAATDEALILQGEPARGPSAEDAVYAQQIQARLALALDRLSERQRAVFTLRHYEDLSLDEIAEVLRVDVGTVKAHLFRALGKLREELRDLYQAGRPETQS